MKKYFTLETLLYFLFGGELLCLCLSYIPSSDLFLHLAVGKQILALGEIPRYDYFSYTAMGAPWLDHEWLTRVIFFLVWREGGFALLHVLKIILVMGAFFFAVLAARKRGVSVLAAVGAGGITALCARGALFFDVRPYIFSYLLLGLFLLLLEIYARSGKRWPLFLMPVLMVPWANLHAAFPAAFLLMGAYLASFAWDFLKKKEGVSKFVPLLLSIIACGLTTMINPYGWRLWEFPFKFLSNDFYRLNLNEWAPPLITGGELPFYVLLGAAVLGFILLKPRRVEDALIIIIFGSMSLSSVRHLPVFSLVIIPFAASCFSAVGQMLRVKMERPVRWETLISAAGIILVIIAAAIRLTGTDLESLSREKYMFPAEAVRFLTANSIEARMFAPYEWGGYIMWELYPRYLVFIDGRANTVYPAETYKQALSVMFGNEGYERILDQHKVDLVLSNKLQVPYNQLIPLKLEKSPEWEEIYEDDISVLFMRKKPMSGEEIKPACGFIYPVTYYRLSEEGRLAIREGDMAKAEKLLIRALKIRPDYVPAWIDLGVALGMSGRGEEAASCFKQALIIDPGVTGARYNLAKYYQGKGDIKKARELLRKELELSPDYKPARDSMEALSR